MLLTYREIESLIQDGVVEGVRPEAINAASLDVHLSQNFLVETTGEGGMPRLVNVAEKETPLFTKVDVGENGVFCMNPGQFSLAATVEVFHLPNDISALFVMKSSVARSGLDQMNAAWCSPGWSGSALTLEIMNVTRVHALALRAGMPIGQMVFFRGAQVPRRALYGVRGRFNGQATVSATGEPPEN